MTEAGAPGDDGCVIAPSVPCDGPLPTMEKVNVAPFDAEPCSVSVVGSFLRTSLLVSSTETVDGGTGRPPLIETVACRGAADESVTRKTNASSRSGLFGV